MPEASASNTSMVSFPCVSGRLDVDTVPFVEIYQNRLQGVVSSGSDVERVYCAFIEAGTGDYYSSTNNNRPDAGMSKRLGWLRNEATARLGSARINDFVARGQRKQEPANEVFSRFLQYLRHVELQAAAGPVPEMNWFVGP